MSYKVGEWLLCIQTISDIVIGTYYKNKRYCISKISDIGSVYIKGDCRVRQHSGYYGFNVTIVNKYFIKERKVKLKRILKIN